MGFSRPPLCKRGRIHDRDCAPQGGDGFFPVRAVLPEEASSSSLSRSVRQRLSRRRAVDARVFEATTALNALAGYETPVAASSSELEGIDRRVWARVREAVASEPVGEEAFCAQEACSALLRAMLSRYDQSDSVVRLFAERDVS